MDAEGLGEEKVENSDDWKDCGGDVNDADGGGDKNGMEGGEEDCGGDDVGEDEVGDGEENGLGDDFLILDGVVPPVFVALIKINE